MTSVEVKNLYNALDKIMHADPVTVKDTIFGDYEGVKLTENEFAMIRPFLGLWQKTVYKVGSVELVEDGPLYYSSTGTIVKMATKEETFHLYAAVRQAINMEEYGRHIKFSDYEKGAF